MQVRHEYLPARLPVDPVDHLLDDVDVAEPQD